MRTYALRDSRALANRHALEGGLKDCPVLVDVCLGAQGGDSSLAMVAAIRTRHLKENVEPM